MAVLCPCLSVLYHFMLLLLHTSTLTQFSHKHTHSLSLTASMYHHSQRDVRMEMAKTKMQRGEVEAGGERNCHTTEWRDEERSWNKRRMKLQLEEENGRKGRASTQRKLNRSLKWLM